MQKAHRPNTQAASRGPVRSVPLYKRFLRLINGRLVAPRQQDPEIRNREIVLNIMLVGTMAVIGLAFMLLCLTYMGGHHYVWPRIVIAAIAVGITFGVYQLGRRGHYYGAAYALLCIYVALATACTYQWGIDLPAVILLDGLIITMAGVLLGARYSLYAAFGITIMVSIIGYGIVQGDITPDRQWTEERISASAIIGFILVFAIISLVNWLFNYQVDRALHRALRAENALLKQKVTLEIQVEKRTRELQTAQLEKVHQLHRFAELGQLSTALLHELANHLTGLSLDIEGLEKRRGSTQVVARAKESISYIDDMVHQVREQLQGKHINNNFGVQDELGKVVAMLQHKAHSSGVALQRQKVGAKPKDTIQFYGDAVRLRQMLTNIISNAIDAYDGADIAPEHRRVTIGIESHLDDLEIKVCDWGKGIEPENIKHVFEPFYSTKQDGMGLGMFITKQIAEQYFGGQLTITSHHGCTTVTLTLKKDVGGSLGQTGS